MNQSDMGRFAQALGVLAEIYGEALSDVRVAAYAQVLNRFDIDQIERGISEAMSSCKFFPKPVELIELIEGAPDEQASRAWQLLIQAVEKGGYYNSLFVEDRVIAGAIRRTFSSWMEIANELPPAADPMYASLYNRFRGNYAMVRKSGEQLERYFVGYYEAQNRQNVSNWDQVSDNANEGTFPLKVIVIANGKCIETKLPFSRSTGALTDGARKQLTTGAVSAYVPKVAALPPARMIEGEADPVQVKKQIAALAGTPRLRVVK